MEVSSDLDAVLPVVEYLSENVVLILSVNVDSKVFKIVSSVDVINLNVVDPSFDVMILVVELSVVVTMFFTDNVGFSDDVDTLCEVDTFCGVVV